MCYSYSIKQNPIPTISSDGTYPPGQCIVIATVRTMCETRSNSALNTLE